jgi:hypothetical protein
MKRVHAKTRRQHGQALTEFLVASVAILPLLLLIPVIAKYQDINHTTLAASRYVAFDATQRNDINNHWKTEQQQADEVRRRFFSNPEAAIKTQDAAGNFKAHQNLFWRTPHDEPLIKDVQKDIVIHYGEGSNSQPQNGFTSASDTTPFVLARQLELNSRGLFTPHVQVNLANLPSGLKFYEPFDTLNLSISRSTTLLLDPWNSRSPQATENKLLHSTEIFPVGALENIAPALNVPITLIELPGKIRAPRLGQLDFWRDVVPTDRIKVRQ